MCLLGFTCETSSKIEEKDRPSPIILDVIRMMDNLHVTVSPETLQDSVQLYTHCSLCKIKNVNLLDQLVYKSLMGAES
jgi:hypothetical protein